MTLIAETHAPDDVYEEVRAQFSEAETVNLTMLIGAINAWNRLAIGFRAVHPVKAKAAACLHRRRLGELDIDLAQPVGHRAGLAVGDLLAVDR